MKKIGITGGVGSGKSKVLEYLNEIEGVVVYQADILAHQVQMPGTSCYKKLCEYFGNEIINDDGTINRPKLGTIVFSDEKKLQMLNQLVHPAVEQRILELMEEEADKGMIYFILEAALLHTPFYCQILDEIWYVYVKEEVRRERLRISRNYTDEKITAMIASQPSEEVFREISSHVIDNSDDFEFTKKQLNDAMRNLYLGDK